MKNSTRKRFRWPLLLLVPILIFAVMLPIARERRKIGLTRQLINEAGHSARLEVMENWIAQGADANGKLRDSEIALRGCTALHLLAGEGDDDVIPQMKLLLQNGADVNAINDYGYTPLMIASNFGYIPNMKFLINHGSNLNARAIPRPIYADSLIKKRTALGIAKAYVQSGYAKSKMAQMNEALRILKAAGAKE